MAPHLYGAIMTVLVAFDQARIRPQLFDHAGNPSLHGDPPAVPSSPIESWSSPETRNTQPHNATDSAGSIAAGAIKKLYSMWG